MRIIVKNLGVIRHADIDLSKNFTLFCGPNGTGKTYVAYILNALYNNWNNNFADNNQESILEYRDSGKVTIKEHHLKDWIKKVESNLLQDIPSIFGITRSESDNLFKNSGISLVTDAEDIERIKETALKYTVYLGSDKVTSFEKKADEMEFRFEVSATQQSSESNYISLMLAQIFKRALLSRHNSRMLTVERNSIYTFKTELTSNRFEAVDQVLISEEGDAESIVKSRANLYPLAVRNSLSVAMDLENIIKQQSEYFGFAKYIEEELLSGSVTVGKEGDVQFNPSNNDRTASVLLPIRMTSSAVKTLSGLVIYLKHLARKGDVLIVDEPEMNLHPDNQRRLARIFARMVNKGIRLVISTHSDYLIREFNNMVMAAALTAGHAKVVEAAGYSQEEILHKDMMQSYFFNFDKNGYVSTETINIDQFGFEVTTIDDTISRQNEATILLSDTLED